MLKSNSIIKIILPCIIFSLGKMVAAAGQTLFGMQYAINYILKSLEINHPITLMLIGIAGLCSLWIILVTRVPAIFRQLGYKQSRACIVNNEIQHDMNVEVIPTASIYKRSIIKIFLACSFAAGIFSAIGAYLGTITLCKFIMFFFTEDKTPHVLIQLFAINITISTFVSYYSFNFHKSHQNIQLLLRKNIIKRILLRLQHDKNMIKTISVSLLSLLSIPFLAYFLTKNALLNMPYVGTILSLYSIKFIAIFSSITALTTSLVTTIPATYEYFTAKENNSKKIKPSVYPFVNYWRFIRNTTYVAGFIDCAANGLSNFVSVIHVAHDAMRVDLYGNVIYVAIGCGISSAVLTATFSVRQGFNDFINHYKVKSS